jgi:hypothetical protein
MYGPTGLAGDTQIAAEPGRPPMNRSGKAWQTAKSGTAEADGSLIPQTNLDINWIRPGDPRSTTLIA